MLSAENISRREVAAMVMTSFCFLDNLPDRGASVFATTSSSALLMLQRTVSIIVHDNLSKFKRVYLFALEVTLFRSDTSIAEPLW